MDTSSISPNPNSERNCNGTEPVNHVSNDIADTSISNDGAQSSLPIDEYGKSVYTSKWLKEHTTIHGWLTFFMFALAIGGFISAFGSLLTIKPEDYANNIFLISTDVLLGFCLLAVALYTIYAFNARRPDAVFWGKFYVVMVLVTNVLSLAFGEFDAYGLHTLKRAIQGVIWSIIWFIYLVNSEQVKEIIPPSFRKIKDRDWWIVAAIVIVPILSFIIGYTQIQNIVRDRETRENSLLSVEISKHERTDGRMIFTIPYSFKCTEEDVAVEGGARIKVYNVENEDIGSITLCCDYDTDVSRRNFNEYRSNWKDDDASIYKERTIDEGEKDINNNPCLYKVTFYDINGVGVYWRFIMLFDKDTGKVAVLSCYDRNEDVSYVEELLRSIRFK